MEGEGTQTSFHLCCSRKKGRRGRGKKERREEVCTFNQSTLSGPREKERATLHWEILLSPFFSTSGTRKIYSLLLESRDRKRKRHKRWVLLLLPLLNSQGLVERKKEGEKGKGRKNKMLSFINIIFSTHLRGKERKGRGKKNSLPRRGDMTKKRTSILSTRFVPRFPSLLLKGGNRASREGGEKEKKREKEEKGRRRNWPPFFFPTFTITGIVGGTGRMRKEGKRGEGGRRRREE